MKIGLLGRSPLGSGAYIDIDRSEGAAIVNTAGSLIRGLAVAGAIIGGIWLLGQVSHRSGYGSSSPPQPPPPPKTPPRPLFPHSRPSNSPPEQEVTVESDEKLRQKLTRNPSGPTLSSFAIAKTRNREIFGVCLDEWIDVYCEGQRMSIPIAFIHEIRFEGKTAGLVIVDGSRFIDVQFVKPYLSFCTLAGIQIVDLNHSHVRFREGKIVNSARNEYTDSQSVFTRKPVTETEILRGVTLPEADKIRDCLLDFLKSEEGSVKQALGRERYDEYLDALLGKPHPEARSKLLTQGWLSASAYPIPPFKWQEKGLLEVIMRGCESSIRDSSGRTVLGINKTDRIEPRQLLFEVGELDFNQGVVIGDGSCTKGKLVFPRQNNLVRGMLKREGDLVFLHMLDAHPCCIYKNGEPIIFDSQVEKTGAIVFGKDDVLEIGDAYALRWHNYYA